MISDISLDDADKLNTYICKTAAVLLARNEYHNDHPDVTDKEKREKFPMSKQEWPLKRSHGRAELQILAPFLAETLYLTEAGRGKTEVWKGRYEGEKKKRKEMKKELKEKSEVDEGKSKDNVKAKT